MQATVADSATALAQAIASGTREIEIHGEIVNAPMVTLPPGTTLRGGTLRFGAKGVRLTRDNTLDGVTIVTPDHEAAILNDTSVADLGTLTLRNVTTRGQVLLIAADAVRAGHVHIEGLRIITADVRGRVERPHGFGVDALQGALTIWNRQPDANVTITAEVLDVSAGSPDTPIRGSGVFVGGHGDWNGKGDGGVLAISELRTGDVHTDGGIPENTPDLISGGVFVISGATVERVINSGTTTTRGQNDMVLDNWGNVRAWTALGPVSSSGPSGIGFVNFGDIHTLNVQAPITTSGRGARGFNLYDGSLAEATFESISTTGDGSVGIQISKPMGALTVHGDVTTTGGAGMSLVKGVQTPLKAVALSVKSGGDVRSITIVGALRTRGENVVTFENEGDVRHLAVTGGIHAEGARSDGAHARGDAAIVSGIEITTTSGERVVVT